MKVTTFRGLAYEFIIYDSPNSVRGGSIVKDYGKPWHTMIEYVSLYSMILDFNVLNLIKPYTSKINIVFNIRSDLGSSTFESSWNSVVWVNEEEFVDVFLNNLNSWLSIYDESSIDSMYIKVIWIKDDAGKWSVNKQDFESSFILETGKGMDIRLLVRVLNTLNRWILKIWSIVSEKMKQIWLKI